MPAFQIGRQAWRHPSDRKFHAAGDGFGRFVEFGDVIVPQIEEVADFLERRGGQNRRRGLTVLAEPRGDCRLLLDGWRYFRWIVTSARPTAGMFMREFAKFSDGDRFTQRRIRQRLAQIRNQPRLVVLGERPAGRARTRC